MRPPRHTQLRSYAGDGAHRRGSQGGVDCYGRVSPAKTPAVLDFRDHTDHD